MTIRQGPIYEVTVFVDHDVVRDYDAWLEAHVRKMLRLVVITDCQAIEVPGDHSERNGPVCS